MLFLEPEESNDSRFMFVGQVKMSFGEDDQVLMMSGSLRVRRDVVASDMLVVCGFPVIFLEDICDLSLV